MTSPLAQARAETYLGKTVADRFRLSALQTAGRAVATFSAEAGDGSPVQVRLLYGDLLGSELDQRFARESQHWPSLRHPHVQPIVAAGTDAALGVRFVASAASKGRDLEHVLAELGALDPAVAVRIAVQVAQAVEAGHRVGLLHRGVRPSSVLLEPEAGDELSIRVRDFGTYRATPPSGGSAADEADNLLDAPDYVAPEQLRDPEKVDERADVFSVGGVLYEMLCGSPPFGHLEEVSDVVTAILTDEAPHLQDRAPWVEPELARVVHRALSYDPNRRYATCEELCSALRRFTRGSEAIAHAELATVSHEVRAKAAQRIDLDAPKSVARPSLVTDGDDLALVGRRIDGKYRVLRLLGRGGMGSVYEVEGPAQEKLAAKVISRGMSGDNPAMLMRFAREAKAASAITSPNVVKTLDAGSDEELALPYIIMELLHGTDLSELLKTQGALDPQLAVRLCLQAARGIAAAHARHVVHRDIKPANLFLEIEANPQREVIVKVCDFGVAKRKRAEEGGRSQHSQFSLTRTGGMLGSPMYMAPEQARNAKSVDERADIWSLSVVLWEALTGDRLWGHQTSLGELIVSICTEPIRRLEELAPWVPPDLARLVHKGLERDIAQRTPNIHSLIAGLELFSGGSDRVTAEQLVGLTNERKAELTRRASSPGERPGSRPTRPRLRGSAPTPVPAVASSSRGWLVGLLLIVALGAAAAVVLLR